MKFGINNPAFLQAAGNHKVIKEGVSFVTASGTIGFNQLDAVGSIDVVYTLRGEVKTDHISDPSSFSSLQVDNGSTVYMYGSITGLSVNNGEFNNDIQSIDLSKAFSLESLSCEYNRITSIDLSACSNLKSLLISGNPLTSIDTTPCRRILMLSCNNTSIETLNISNNELLEDLSISNNSNIKNIYAIASYPQIANPIASLIESATATDGTVTLRNGDAYNSTISDAATTKGWTVEYVDA